MHLKTVFLLLHQEVRILLYKFYMINVLSFFLSALQCFSGGERDLRECFVGTAVHADQLQFREQALVALLSMLGENVQRYREESTKLDHLTEKLSNGMPGKSQLDTRMVINRTIVRSALHSQGESMVKKPLANSSLLVRRWHLWL